MKDAVATMGDVLPPDASGRDAVHVAVFSATAPTTVFPGQDVGIADRDSSPDALVSPKVGPLVGIVDPFIRGMIPVGARFWVYLYPRTITALAHRWSHPAFGDNAATVYATPNSRAASEKWLRDFVARSDIPDYETVIDTVRAYVEDTVTGWDAEYVTFNQQASGDIPPEFWDHVAVVLGRSVKGPRPSYFSCSC